MAEDHSQWWTLVLEMSKLGFYYKRLSWSGNFKSRKTGSPL